MQIYLIPSEYRTDEDTTTAKRYVKIDQRYIIYADKTRKDEKKSATRGIRLFVGPKQDKLNTGSIQPASPPQNLTTFRLSHFFFACVLFLVATTRGTNFAGVFLNLFSKEKIFIVSDSCILHIAATLLVIFDFPTWIAKRRSPRVRVQYIYGICMILCHLTQLTGLIDQGQKPPTIFVRLDFLKCVQIFLSSKTQICSVCLDLLYCTEKIQKRFLYRNKGKCEHT